MARTRNTHHVEFREDLLVLRDHQIRLHDPFCVTDNEDGLVGLGRLQQVGGVLRVVCLAVGADGRGHHGDGANEGGPERVGHVGAVGLPDAAGDKVGNGAAMGVARGGGLNGAVVFGDGGEVDAGELQT